MPFCNSLRALYPAASPDSFFRLYSSRTCVGDRRSAGGWRRAAADQWLCSAGADDSWSGNRKYFALPSAAQSRRHRGRADRGGVLVCVVLPLSPVLFRDLYCKVFVCVVTANACVYVPQCPLSNDTIE